MKTKLLAILALTSAFSLQPSALLLAAPLGTAFTYQGRLNEAGNPTQGLYDLRFTIYDAAGDGTAVAGPITNSPVGVTNGLFTVSLDFGGSVFDGNARWLEIAVRSNGSGAFTMLNPRQALTPTPYALFASNTATLGGQAPSAFAPASGSTAYVARSGDTMTGTLNLPANGLVAGGSQLVLSGGNVGIGTISPAAKLDVAGTVQGELILSKGGGLELGNSLGSGTVSYIDFHYGVGTNQDYNVRLLNTADRQLWCDGQFGVTGAELITSRNSDEGGTLDLQNLRKTGAAQAGVWKLFNMTGIYGDGLGLYTVLGSGSVARRLFIADDGTTILAPSGGNVGIGTASPAKALEVRREVLIKGNDDGGTEYSDWPYPSLSIRRSDNFAANGVTMLSLGYRNDPLYSTDDSVANIRLWDPAPRSPNAATSTNTTQLRIASPGPLVLQPNGGNVGIGTASPAAKLEVQGGPIKATGGLIIETRTSDPPSPVTGQMWLRTDL